jgi:hypothetical protein
MGTATPLRVSPERCPLIVEFMQLPVRSITTPPDAHCGSPEVDADACVANQQRRDPRRHRSRHHERAHGRTEELRKGRQGIERMPKSTTMPNNQASSRELSELSRTKAN